MNFKTLWVKRLFRALLGTTLLLGVLAGAVHTFLYYRAGELFRRFVEKTSDGNYSASTEKLRFGYFPLKIKATGVDFYPLDTAGLRKKYFIRADSIQLRLTSLVPILFENSLLVKEVRLVKPMVRMESAVKRMPGNDLNFNTALKEMQDGLLNSLALLQVDKCDIIDGGFNFWRTDENERLAVNHINLAIDSLVVARSGVLKTGADTINANLLVSIENPDITLPDSNYLVDLERLFVDTRKNVFNIDELSFSRKKKLGAHDTLKLSSIALRGLNWKRFLEEGMIALDSVRIKNGLAHVDLTDREIFRRRAGRNREDGLTRIAVPLLLKHVSIAEVTYRLRSLRKTGPFTILVDGDSLQMSSFALRDASERPVSIGSLSMNVRNYYDQDDKKTYLAGFDRLQIRNDDLSIGNYRLIPLKRAGFSSNNRIKIPSLVLYNYDLASLLQGRLQADRLELIRPEVVLDILHKRDGKPLAAGDGLFKALNGLQRTLDIRELSISDASVILQPRNDLANSITISQLNTELNVEKLLDASSVNDLMQVAEDIHSDGFFISGPRFDLQVTDALVVKGSEQVNIGRLKGNISNVLEVDLDSVSIKAVPGGFLIPVAGRLDLESVNVGGGVVMVINEEVADSAKPGGKPAPDLNIGLLKTGPLQVTYFKNNGSMFAVQQLLVDMQGLETGRNRLNWQNLFMEGKTLVTTAGRENIRVGEWEGNLPGNLTLRQVKLWPSNRSSFGINIDVPEMEARNIIHGVKWNPGSVTDLRLVNPQVTWNSEPSSTAGVKAKGKTPPPFFLRTVSIIDPEVSGYRLTQSGQKRHIMLEKGELEFRNVDLFYSRPDFIGISSVKASLVQPQFELDTNWTLHPQTVRLLASAFNWQPGRQPSAMVDSLQVDGIGGIPLAHRQNMTLTVDKAGGAGWAYPFPKDTLWNRFLNGPEWWVSGVNYSFKAPGSRLQVFNAAATGKDRMVQFDSLLWLPDKSREDFWAGQPWEKDYLTLKLGETSLKQVNPLAFFEKDSVASVQLVQTKNLQLLAARDKRFPDDSVTYRPLLAAQIGQLPFALRVDSLLLENGNVAYHEISDRFEREGLLTLDQLNGSITHVYSRPQWYDDSLQLDMQGRFMQHAPIRLRYTQPYNDTLQGFSYRVNMGQWPLSALNPLVVPLASVAFRRGQADTLWLNALGNKYRAYGWMGFQYRQMAVDVLRYGRYGRYFGRGTVNAATNLVLTNNNNGNTTPLYAERLTNKATFNFWSKILAAGLKANVGVPGRRKSARRAMRKENISTQSPRP